MLRSFRFLLGRFWPCLAVMAVLAAAAAGSQALWLPPWTRTVFQWCFALLPKLLPSVLLFAGFFPWGRSMNLALSMGAGRRGLFGAVHLLFLVFAAAAWAVQRAVCALPAPFLPAMTERFPALAPAEAASPWVYFLLCLMMLLLGSACGILSALYSQAVSLVFFLIVGGLNLSDWSFLSLAQVLWGEGASWGALPYVLSALTAAGCEGFLWSTIQTYVVR